MTKWGVAEKPGRHANSEARRGEIDTKRSERLKTIDGLKLRVDSQHHPKVLKVQVEADGAAEIAWFRETEPRK